MTLCERSLSFNWNWQRWCTDWLRCKNQAVGVVKGCGQANIFQTSEVQIHRYKSGNQNFPLYVDSSLVHTHKFFFKRSFYCAFCVSENWPFGKAPSGWRCSETHTAFFQASDRPTWFWVLGYIITCCFDMLLTALWFVFALSFWQILFLKECLCWWDFRFSRIPAYISFCCNYSECCSTEVRSYQSYSLMVKRIKDVKLYLYVLLCLAAPANMLFILEDLVKNMTELLHAWSHILTRCFYKSLSVRGADTVIIGVSTWTIWCMHKKMCVLLGYVCGTECVCMCARDK